MISSRKISPLAILWIFLKGPYSKYVTWEGEGSRRRKKQNVTWKEGRAVKKVIYLTQNLLCTFLSNSIFIPSWFLMALIILQRATKRAIQERAYRCIWNNYIIFAQKYYNSTFLSMWVVYLKIRLRHKMWFFTSLDITGQAEAAIHEKKISFLSFYSFLVKLSEWHRWSARVKLTKCDK